MDLAQLTSLSELHGTMSGRAQKAAALLSALENLLVDPAVRAELRAYVDACERSGVDPADVDRARIVVAAFDGQVGEPHASGEGVIAIGIRH